MSPDTRVVVAGTGAIGRTVAEALVRGEVAGCVLLAVVNSASTPSEVQAALEAADVLVEATTVEAARSVVPQALAAGTDVVLCSCGVLAEQAEAPTEHAAARTEQAAAPAEQAAALTEQASVRTGQAGGLAEQPTSRPTGRLLLPAGALGGFDILAAAARAGSEGAQIRHTTTKKPAALNVDPNIQEPVEVFRGTARQAALTYPRTSNSSVALALATLGLDQVEVVVVADPKAKITRHEVEWTSPIGSYRMSFENAVDPNSGGRTSAITAWSVIDLLAGLHRGVGPGAVVVDGAVVVNPAGSLV
ncbi:aspartate dehydrogenase domain-containing protein [Kineosporia babensis]|uniref:DUF108 domain-containing protein n=1 Tax=Kineosporia babensis TaxID=499548 RepID=A0A9X1NID1_9ACTN|nr:aspartate dehydrogenase domain-containing protein [Kineosporia babensis]MCD5313653.1 DUF108 domain-containing protein [Kineosporia babensis]